MPFLVPGTFLLPSPHPSPPSQPFLLVHSYFVFRSAETPLLEVLDSPPSHRGAQVSFSVLHDVLGLLCVVPATLLCMTSWPIHLPLEMMGSVSTGKASASFTFQG